MGEAATIIIAVLITFPLLVFLLLSFLLAKYRKKRPVRMAADMITPLFLGAVIMLWIELWGVGALWLLFLLVLISSAGFTFVHWYAKGDIEFRKLRMGLWRLFFLFFFIIYIFLVGYGVVTNIVTYVSS